MLDPLRFKDGCGEEYEVLDYGARFTVRQVGCDATAVVDTATLHKLGVKWDGRTLSLAKDPGGSPWLSPST